MRNGNNASIMPEILLKCTSLNHQNRGSTIAHRHTHTLKSTSRGVSRDTEASWNALELLDSNEEFHKFSFELNSKLIFLPNTWNLPNGGHYSSDRMMSGNTTTGKRKRSSQLKCMHALCIASRQREEWTNYRTRKAGGEFEHRQWPLNCQVDQVTFEK